MSHRERLTSGRESGALGRPVAGCEAQLSPSRPSGAVASCKLLWESLYRSASSTEQRELLRLAREQGLLYGHQLPAACNGAATACEPAEERLLRLLNGQCEELEPVHAVSVAVYDGALDPRQREAVAKALATPDLCLLQGLPGASQTRVVAEILTQAAARGERVLLLAHSPHALDRILELVGNREVICPVRCVDPSERAEAMPASLRSFTFDERVRELSEWPLQRAREGLAAADECCTRCRQQAPLLARLDELAGQRELLGQESQALQNKRSRILIEVEEEAAKAATEDEQGDAGRFRAAVRALASSHQETVTSIDAACAAACARMAELQQEQVAQEKRLETLWPLADAKRRHRWWTAAWWRATFRGSVSASWTTLQGKNQQAQATLEQLGQEVEHLALQSQEAQRAFQVERARLVHDETTRRQAELQPREAACQHALDLLQQQWQQTLRQLDLDGLGSAAITCETVQTAREAWRHKLERQEQHLAFARQWIACLEEFAANATERLREYVNLVTATTSGLPADVHFGDRAAPVGVFDLLVLKEADRVTESEFRNLARRARRWVLVGGARGESERGGGCESERVGGCESGRVRELEAEGARGPRSGSAATFAPHRQLATSPSHHPTLSASPALPVGFFHRLWQWFHCDPRTLPYAWVQENGRLCCRFRHVTAEQRRWIECESVADFPEIELRILSMPRVPPVLAEVAFPLSMGIDQAKQYIYRELEELSITSPSDNLTWIEEPERVVLALAESETSQEIPVPLETGVCEWVTTAPENGNGCDAPSGCWYTCRIEFQGAANWNRCRAEAWVRRHLRLRDLGRTVRLEAARERSLQLCESGGA